MMRAGLLVLSLSALLASCAAETVPPHRPECAKPTTPVDGGIGGTGGRPGDCPPEA